MPHSEKAAGLSAAIALTKAYAARYSVVPRQHNMMTRRVPSADCSTGSSNATPKQFAPSTAMFWWQRSGRQPVLPYALSVGGAYLSP